MTLKKKYAIIKSHTYLLDSLDGFERGDNRADCNHSGRHKKGTYDRILYSLLRHTEQTQSLRHCYHGEIHFGRYRSYNREDDDRLAGRIRADSINLKYQQKIMQKSATNSSFSQYLVVQLSDLPDFLYLYESKLMLIDPV